MLTVFCAEGVIKLPAITLDRTELDFGFVFVGGGPQKSEMQIAVINNSECDAIWSLELGSPAHSPFSQYLIKGFDSLFEFIIWHFTLFVQ